MEEKWNWVAEFATTKNLGSRCQSLNRTVAMLWENMNFNLTIFNIMESGLLLIKYGRSV